MEPSFRKPYAAAIVILACTALASCTLISTPQNTAANVGEQVILDCAQNVSDYSNIQWTFYDLNNTKCAIYRGLTAGNCNASTGWYAETTGGVGVYNLRTNSVKLAGAGRYECESLSGTSQTASAFLNVVEKECHYNFSNPPINHTATLYCSIFLVGELPSTISLDGTCNFGNVVIGDTFVFDAPVPQPECNISLSFSATSPTSTVASNMIQASNTPTYYESLRPLFNSLFVTATATGGVGALPTTKVNAQTSAPAVVVDKSPSVDDIFPKLHIITGGTTVFVSGNNLNYVNVSQLVVTLVHTWTDTITNGRHTERHNFTSQPCVIKNSSLLACIIPPITLPDEFRNITDTAQYSPYKKSAFSSFSTANSTLVFYVNVQLDGSIYPWNRTNDLQFTYRLPTLTVSGLQTFMPSNPSQVDVKGSHLSYGVTLSTDYQVMIGDGQCQPQGQLTDNLIHCLPPTAQPQHNSVDLAFCSDDFALIVELRVSRTSLGLAGCLHYQPSSNNHLLAIVLGTVLGGVGLLLLIVVLVVVVRCCCCKQPTRDSRQSAVGAEYTTHVDQLDIDVAEYTKRIPNNNGSAVKLNSI